MPTTHAETLAARLALRLEVGRRLADARRNAGLSQAQAAKSLGLAQSAIAKVELGRRAASFVEVLALADLYGIDPVTLDPRRPPAAAPPHAGRPRERLGSRNRES
jgi:transcriptional regulator with XRE-family HTH domain